MLQNRNRHNDKNVYRKNPTGKLKLKIQRVKKNEARRCYRIKIGTTIRGFIEGKLIGN